MAFLVAVTDRVLQLATCQRYQVLGPVIAVCAARGLAFLTGFYGGTQYKFGKF